MLAGLLHQRIEFLRRELREDVFVLRELHCSPLKVVLQANGFGVVRQVG